MPLYYFDFRYADGHSLTDQGMWFPDLSAAEREARTIAKEIRNKIGLKRVEACIRDQSKTIQKEIVVSE
jgi:hypothetical protein